MNTTTIPPTTIQSNTELLSETIQLKKNLEKNFFELGARLQKIRDEQLYRGVYYSFKDFLDEMKLTESFASRLITVHKRFIGEFQMNPDDLASIGWSSLYQIAKHTKDREEATELVGMANLVRREDLEDELRERRSGCQNHQFTEEVLILKKCKNCGKMIREYGEAH
jgi:hypothetical protein